MGKSTPETRDFPKIMGVSCHFSHQSIEIHYDYRFYYEYTLMILIYNQYDFNARFIYGFFIYLIESMIRNLWKP